MTTDTAQVSTPQPLTQRIDYQGKPAIHLRSPDGAEAIILEHGAHVVSWKPAHGVERLYLSPIAIFSDNTPVRGGVPVIFPQFGLRGPLQGHGFARKMNWEFVSTQSGKDHAIVTLRLTDNAETRAQWPHAFSLEIAVNISGGRLDVELEVCNTGETAFDFTAALHTYLAVREVEECTIEGLRGLNCEDSLTGHDFLEPRAAFKIEEEVDRIYYDTTKPLLLNEEQRGLIIQSENMPDTVIWNPWETLSKKLADLPDDGFRKMLCIEAAVVRKPVTLAPGEEWWGRQTLATLD